MTEWYYSAGDGVQRGPVDAAGLKRLADGGRLSPSDLVWREGMTEWAPASKVAGLFRSEEPPLKPSPPLGAESDFAPYPEAQPRPVSGRRYAGFWLRFVAYFVDVIVVMVGSLVVGVALAVAMVAAGVQLNEDSPIWNLTGVVAAWLYYALMESSREQATLGKMALGLKVTDLNGYPISFGRASGRFFGKFLSGLLFCLGFIMAGVTERKQALHDILAGTLVVRR